MVRKKLKKKKMCWFSRRCEDSNGEILFLIFLFISIGIFIGHNLWGIDDDVENELFDCSLYINDSGGDSVDWKVELRSLQKSHGSKDVPRMYDLMDEYCEVINPSSIEPDPDMGVTVNNCFDGTIYTSLSAKMWFCCWVPINDDFSVIVEVK